MKFPLAFSPRRMLAVTRKEFQEMIRSWMSFLLAIVSPIALFFLFAYGMPLEVKNIPLAIMDEDKSYASRALIDCFANGLVFEIRQMLDDYRELDRVMRIGRVRACVVIPARFSQNIRNGLPQSVQVIIDATYPSRANIVGGYAEATLSNFNLMVLQNYLARAFGSAGRGDVLPVSIESIAWFNPSLRSENFVVPGVIAIILIFLPPILAAISLSKEKETGSIINMLCSPITRAEYLIGKMVPYIIITYANFVLFLIFTIFVFHVPMRGSLPLLLGVSLIYVISVIGIGLLIAVLVKSQISAILVVAVTTLITSFMYSGFMLPLICMDQNTRQVAMILPPTHYIDFVRKLMVKGVGIEYLWVNILALSLLSLLMFGGAIMFFRKKLT